MVIDKTPQTHHPQFGEVIYDGDGKIVCHICGKSFKKLCSHVWQKHGIFEKEYKAMFGLNTSHGLIAQSTRQKLQRAVAKHYDKVVAQNLVKNGANTRFKEGDPGRTRDKLSEQQRRVLVARAKRIGFGRSV